MSDYIARGADAVVEELLQEAPALLILGPRATGKTTTAARFARSLVRLDREAEAAAFRADPDAALAALEVPVLLDEWQLVPEVLGAVKRAVDADRTPGRYLITGSVHADLEAPTWAGTGRVLRLGLWPMTVAERLQLRTRPFLDRVASGAELLPAREAVDLRGYVELALTSGFPQAVFARRESARRRWLESYVEQMLTRDALDLEAGRDPVRLRRYFEAYALNTAGIVEEKTLYEAAGVNRKTALAYERLLTNLLVVEALPAWTSNRLKRLTLAPKRHLIDPGLLVGALGIDLAGVMSDGDLLGRVLESFVAAHLRAEASYTSTRGHLYHLRTEQGRQEIDLVAEFGGGKIVGMEVKATSAPNSKDAAHLAWLRDQLGARFVRGVVLHTGPRSFELGERIAAVPISALWGPG
ncbi:MAG: ATP-binding protein [Planctomycetes bacterium]|nr:ATP-binding protein [Planctomycetota bacterium]